MTDAGPPRIMISCTPFRWRSFGYRPCGADSECFREYLCETCYDTVKESVADIDESLRLHADACERRQEMRLVETAS